MKGFGEHDMRKPGVQAAAKLHVTHLLASGPYSLQLLGIAGLRQIWTDAKAVEIQKEASLSDNEKVVNSAVRFFLGGDKEREEAAEEDSDGEEIDMDKLRHQALINKKSKKQARDLKKAAATVKRKDKKKSAPHPLNFSAFHLLHDPNGFAETLFSKQVNSSKCKFTLDTKLLCLNLITRLVGLHKLQILSLYSDFLKYLTPSQTSVTSFLFPASGDSPDASTSSDMVTSVLLARCQSRDQRPAVITIF